MNKMKKLMVLALAMMMSVSMLGGCGSSSTASTTAAAEAAETEAAEAADTEAAEAADTADEDLPEVHVTFCNMLAEDHPQSIAAKEVLAKEVSEATGGKFTIDVQVNGVLGSDAETVEATTMGNMEMCGPAAATLATLDSNWYVLDIPYVFLSPTQARNALDGELGEYLADSLEQTAGLICLAVGESGMRNLSNNTKEITSPEDLAGMKIRVLENKYHLSTFSALGANPTAMAFGEVYTAMQTNQIDGQDNPITITCTNKFYEVQSYYTLTQHMFCANTVCVNAEWFYSLPESYQEILRQAAADMIAEQRRLIDENEASYVEEMEANGCKVTELTDDQKQAFVDATQTVRDEFVEEFGEAGQNMLDLAAKYAE